MVIFLLFQTTKLHALHANDVGEAIASNTPVFVVSADILMLKALNMDVQHVNAIYITAILIILFTLTDHSSVDGTL